MLRPIGRLYVALPMILSAACGHSPSVAEVQPPPGVTVTTVAQRDVPLYGEWVGTLDGFVNARIQPQVTGYVIRQAYREGVRVRTGDVLFEIDPRPFRAVLDRAQGQLHQSQALQDRAAQDVERDRPLAAARAIPQSQFDTEVQLLVAAQAAVRAAQAEVEAAEVNLGFTTVRSLVDGLAGIATVQVGNLVGPNSVLTTVSQVEPIKAFFSISESDYLRFPAAVLGAQRQRDAWSGAAPFELILADGSSHVRRGSFFAVDRAVDLQTGTITVVATFPNPQGVLRPGQFGRVRARLETLKGAITVPQRAVTELQGAYQVAVVDGHSMAAIRPVVVGPRSGADWVIRQGLVAGDRVVVDGVQKVRDGMPVTLRPDAPVGGQSGQP